MYIKVQTINMSSSTLYVPKVYIKILKITLIDDAGH